MRSLLPAFVCLAFLLTGCGEKALNKAGTAIYPIHGIAFNKVKINDTFWLLKIETNRTVTIPASFAKCEEYGRMDNFLIAGGKMSGPVKGKMPFDDTDVYKIIEGASYSLATTPDPKLDAYLDSVIALIAIGQEKDGYLTTYKTIDTTYSPARWCPPAGRWRNLSCSHELYNSGHLFEAASAHYLATGKKNFLHIATKNADLLVSVFLKGENTGVPGHQIVETGLVKLYLITGKTDYLKLARHFLDFRGDSTKRQLWGAYNQDHKPVTQQDEAVGHAVRAGYMYSGMTDIAALYHDLAYTRAVDIIWENMVYKKLYLTGGIGSRHQGEAFGENYELPNLTAYNETCAAIANVYWNYRMFLLHGESKYIDILERSLYNGVISGVSLDGKCFFYPNPLECDRHFLFNSMETLDRQPWFDCSCCPTNLCRFLPSVPGYIYAQDGNKLYVNLFVQSETTFTTENKLKVHLTQQTEYPWSGEVKITVSPDKTGAFALLLRLPGWATGKPVPGDLYSYLTPGKKEITLMLNGQACQYDTDKGYAVISREWNRGDVLEYSMPMDIQKVTANEKVKDDLGKIAIERGPLVYCLEGADNSFPLFDITFSENSRFTPSFRQNELGGIMVISGEGWLKDKPVPVTAIPYFSWNNRGINEMRVWFPRITD